MSVADPYVAALDSSLRGPRRVRRGLVQEARDHLDDASDAYERAGYDRSEAERIAVADFGELDEIVPAFQTTLAVAAARRTSWLLLGVLSIQPFLWDGPFSSDDAVAPDGLLYRILDTGVEYLGAAMLLSAVLLVIASGIGNRWFHAGRGIARVTSYTAIGTAVSMKLTGVAMVLLSNGLGITPWLMLLAFIFVPMGITASSARRTLAIC